MGHSSFAGEQGPASSTASPRLFRHPYLKLTTSNRPASSSPTSMRSVALVESRDVFVRAVVADALELQRFQCTYVSPEALQARQLLTSEFRELRTHAVVVRLAAAQPCDQLPNGGIATWIRFLVPRAAPVSLERGQHLPGAYSSTRVPVAPGRILTQRRDGGGRIRHEPGLDVVLACEQRIWPREHSRRRRTADGATRRDHHSAAPRITTHGRNS